MISSSYRRLLTKRKNDQIEKIMLVLRELRKARTVTFLRNGDINNAPKTIQLTPHRLGFFPKFSKIFEVFPKKLKTLRYIGFAELQNDLTKKLNLPHGCRIAARFYMSYKLSQKEAFHVEKQDLYLSK